MSQKLNENFDSKIAVDPFYSASNMAHLRRGIDALDAGNGVEHEIIEDTAIAFTIGNVLQFVYHQQANMIDPYNLVELADKDINAQSAR